MPTSLSFAPLIPAWPPQKDQIHPAPAHKQVHSGLLSVFCFQGHGAGLGTAAMQTQPRALA